MLESAVSIAPTIVLDFEEMRKQVMTVLVVVRDGSSRGLRGLQPELGKKKMGEEENRERRGSGRGGRRHQPSYVSWLDPPL